MASNTASGISYQLSAEISGHSGDVRAVYAFGGEEKTTSLVLTASRDKTACLWKRVVGESGVVLVKKMTQHGGYVSAVCVIPADEPLIVTASQDKTILVHSMAPGVHEPLERYIGHTNLVSSIIYQHENLLSVSWDSTMRVWKRTSPHCDVIQAHKPAVWAVSGLFQFDGTKRVLTGGADKAIRLWEIETKLCIQEYRGHSDVVRDVKVIGADVFLSASNDCTIRKWNIHSAQCLMEFCSHEAFVYSISPFFGLVDDFVSCGEDGTVRIWRNGSCAQTIRLPAVSVWSVSVMDNGDIVAGSSDSVARIFTVSSERKASPQHLSNFDSQVEEYLATKDNKSIDVSTLPGMSALEAPGKSTGDTKLVNNNGRAEVYQWNVSVMQWEKIGDAVGQAPTDTNKLHNGKEYDYVFDIEIDDEGPDLRKLKLPYNKTDDPYEAAERFIVNNDIPVWYLDQVAEFIMKNADVQYGPGAVSDPFTGGNRYIPGRGAHGDTGAAGGQDPFTGGSRYVPNAGRQDTKPHPPAGGQDPFTGGSRYVPNAGQDTKPHPPAGRDPFTGSSSYTPGATNSEDPYFPMASFKTFTSPSDYHLKIISKLSEFVNSVPKCKISEEELGVIQQLSSSLATPTSVLETSSLELLSRIFEWPEENMFPVLDILRLAMLNEFSNLYFTQESVHLLTLLERLACGPSSQPKNQLLVLRILSNSVVHSTGQQWLTNDTDKFVRILDGLVVNSNRNCQIALSTALLNYCHLCYGTGDSRGITECAQVAIKILRSPAHDLEAKFRTLQSIGTLCLSNMKPLTDVISIDDLISLIAPLCDVTDHPKMSGCALYLIEKLMAA